MFDPGFRVTANDPLPGQVSLVSGRTVPHLPDIPESRGRRAADVVARILRRRLPDNAGRIGLPLPSLVGSACLLLISVVALAADTYGAETSPTEEATAEAIAGLKHKVAAVYDRVRTAIVRVDGKQGRVSGGGTGVIVSEDGLVLLPASLTRMELTFQLDDGRNVAGKALGWSDEFCIGMAKLDGMGPWPHVDLAQSPRPLLGQAVVTLTIPASATSIVPHPLLAVSWIDRSAPGAWFMTPGIKSTTLWHRTVIAFDLDARLVGVMGKRWGDVRQIFTDTEAVRTIFNDLAAGKNVDRQRLVPTNLEEASDGQAARAAESVLPAVEEAVLSASVQIRRQPKQKGWSGTLIAADGLIATCAHHFVMPGTKVTVSLRDGRDVAGEVLGINLVCDIGLVRITEPGPFPHVTLGDSLRLQPGARCLFVGYGPLSKKARQALLRETSVVAEKDGRWSHLLCTNPETLFVGGDSGGGVFDTQGHLVAIHTGLGSAGADATPHTNPRAELFQKHWDELHAGLQHTDHSPLAPVEAGLKRVAESALPSVVQIHEGNRCVALGTIISADGAILSKASSLGEKPVCVLADGRAFPAKILSSIRELDLVVLKIDATELQPVVWSKQDNPDVGSVVATFADNPAIGIGFVSHPMLSLPRERGSLGARLVDGADGIEVAEVADFATGPEFASFGPQQLKKGDLLLTINDRPVRAVADVKVLLNVDQDDPVGISGDPVRLGIKRNGQAMEVRQLLRPPSWPRFAGQSPRSTGFRRAVSVATLTDQGLLGGPVINDEGHAVGIAIAGRERGWLCVIPASDVANVLPK